MRRGLRLILVGAVAAGLVPAAEGRDEEAGSPRPCWSAGYVHLRTAELAHAAVLRRAAWAYRTPGEGRIDRFERLNVNRVPTVFGVLAAGLGPDCRSVWYQVQLPRRPNGAIGYVRAADVTVLPVRTRIVVELSKRRVTLFRNGRKLLHTAAAIGSPATPTPLGSFYVNQRLIPFNTSGPFGPGAVGISAFSDVLTGWAQGGPIAIHGTNQPWSIGRAISNGCIRVRNPVLRRIFALAVAGTPVLIRS